MAVAKSKSVTLVAELRGNRHLSWATVVAMAPGFSLFALAFAERSRGNARTMRIGFAIALTAGIVFSLVRVVQGAHFLSHALWAASIDWLCAALVFRLFRPSSVAAALEARP